MNSYIKIALAALTLSMPATQLAKYYKASGIIAYEIADTRFPNSNAVTFSEAAGPQNGKISLTEKDDSVIIHIRHPEIVVTVDPTFWEFFFGMSKRTLKRLDYLPPYFLEISNDGKTVTLKTKTKVLAVMPVDNAPIAAKYRGTTIRKDESEFLVTIPTK